jgi:hypothetical protein
MPRKISLKKQLTPTRGFHTTFGAHRGCKFYNVGFKRNRVSRLPGLLNVMVVYADGRQATHPRTYHRSWFK